MTDPRRDVTGLPPADQHTTALTVLDDRTGLPGAGGWQGGRDLEGLHGRRAILERHAPHQQVPTGRSWCAYCLNTRLTGQLWPCPDYVSAAAGLITGLVPA